MRACFGSLTIRRARWPSYPTSLPVLSYVSFRVRVVHTLAALPNHALKRSEPEPNADLDHDGLPDNAELEPSTNAKTFAAGSRGWRKCSFTTSAINGTRNNETAPASFASRGAKHCAHTIACGFSRWAKTTIPSHPI